VSIFASCIVEKYNCRRSTHWK